MYNLFKGLAIIIFMLTLIGCESPRDRMEKQLKENPELSLENDIYVGNGIYRLENSEVICYHDYDDSLQCKFKGE